MRRQRGGVLLLAVILLMAMAGLTVLLKALNAATTKAAWPAEAAAQLLVVDDALKGYASSHRRLPCAADGRIASGTAGVGLEARNANGDCTAQSTGVVPWATLGLPEASVTDAWGGRLTYRVPTGGNGLTRDGALDATNCDPLGTKAATAATATTAIACANTCTVSGPPPALPFNPANCTSPAAFLAGRGLPVVDASGATIRNPAANTGAAYVVIGQGPEGGGAYTASGRLTASAVPAGANGEVRNQNNQDIPMGGYFYDPTVQSGEGAGAAHFDDQLSYPTIAELLAKTGLGARHH